MGATALVRARVPTWRSGASATWPPRNQRASAGTSRPRTPGSPPRAGATRSSHAHPDQGRRVEEYGG